MKSDPFSFSKFIMVIGVAVLSTHCGGGNYIQPPEWGKTAAPAASYSISGVANFGIENDGLIHLELQGNFSAFQDSVIATCTSTTPQVIVTSDAYNAIDFTLTPENDTCTFSVQNSYYGTNNTVSETISASQTALNISYGFDNGPDSPGSDLDDIVLRGTFNGHNNDQVWAACDGAPAFTQASAAAASFDSTTEVVAAIPAPLNFFSCQFLVTGNGIQGSTYAALSIVNATDLATDSSSGNDTIRLDGSFVGPTSGLGGDQVWAACDGATSYTQIQSTNIISDGFTSIQFLLTTPLDFNSCDFYVIGNGFQSATY